MDLVWVLIFVGGGFLFAVLFGLMLWQLCCPDELQVSVSPDEKEQVPEHSSTVQPPAIVPAGGKHPLGSAVTVIPVPGSQVYVRFAAEADVSGKEFELWDQRPIVLAQQGRFLLQAFSTSVGAHDSHVTTAHIEAVVEPPPQDPVTYSHSAGLYSEPFLLSLWHPSADAILYTVGPPGRVADPYTCPPAFVYSEPICVTESVEVRAVAYGSPAPATVRVYNVSQTVQEPVLVLVDQADGPAPVSRDAHGVIHTVHDAKLRFDCSAGASVHYSVRAAGVVSGAEPCCVYCGPIQLPTGLCFVESMATKAGLKDSARVRWIVQIPSAPPPRSPSRLDAVPRKVPTNPPSSTSSSTSIPPQTGAVHAFVRPKRADHVVGEVPFRIAVSSSDPSRTQGLEVTVTALRQEGPHSEVTVLGAEGADVEIVDLGRVEVVAIPILPPYYPAGASELQGRIEREYRLVPPPPSLTEVEGGVRVAVRTPGWWRGRQWRCMVTTDGSVPRCGNAAAVMLDDGQVAPTKPGAMVLALTAVVHCRTGAVTPELATFSDVVELKIGGGTVAGDRSRGLDLGPPPRAAPPVFSPKAEQHTSDALEVRMRSGMADGLSHIRWKRDWDADDLEAGGGCVYDPQRPPVFDASDMGPQGLIRLSAVTHAPALGLAPSAVVSKLYRVKRPRRSFAAEAAAAATTAALTLVASHRPRARPPPKPRLTCHAAELSVTILTAEAAAEAWFSTDGSQPTPGAPGSSLLKRGAVVHVPGVGTTDLRARSVHGGSMSEVVQRIFVEGFVPAAHAGAEPPGSPGCYLEGPCGTDPPDPPSFVAHARSVVVVAKVDDRSAEMRYSTDGTAVRVTDPVFPESGLCVPVSTARRGWDLRVAAFKSGVSSGDTLNRFEHREAVVPQWVADAASKAEVSASPHTRGTVSAADRRDLGSPRASEPPTPAAAEPPPPPPPPPPPAVADALAAGPPRARPARDGFSDGRRAAKAAAERRAAASLREAREMQQAAATLRTQEP